MLKYAQAERTQGVRAMYHTPTVESHAYFTIGIRDTRYGRVKHDLGRLQKFHRFCLDNGLESSFINR